jgi:hypothetical protein
MAIILLDDRRYVKMLPIALIGADYDQQGGLFFSHPFLDSGV